MVTTKRALLGMAIASFAAIGWTSFHNPMELSPSSQLWVEGKSTVKDWKCVAEMLQARIDAPEAGASTKVLAGEKAISAVDLTIPVEKMNCNNNGTMNEHMRKALKAKENPTIAFRLISYELASAENGRKGTLNGMLTIGGVEKPVALSVDMTAAADGGMRVKGTQLLKMSDFGLKPPSLMLGAMKVKDQVTVGFDLLLEK